MKLLYICFLILVFNGILYSAEARNTKVVEVTIKIDKADWDGDIEAAIKDAKTLDPDIVKYTRYFTFKGTIVKDEKELKIAHQIFIFHLWSIAHKPEPPKLRFITPTLVSINLKYFGIDQFVFGRLAYVDPYHHVLLTEDGKKVKTFAAAPQTSKNIAELIKLTTSQLCILRWDWFWIQSSIQEGRGEVGQGTGYYDFIGVKNRDDYFKLIGADVKKAEELYHQWIGIIKESGVAYFPRQVQRESIFGGARWFTRDILDPPVGNRNALRQLDKDFKHQAEEHYAPGPSGLPVYLACNSDGVLQNSAPDRVGPDKTRSGNRTTIDVNASCVRCHIEILRPIDNWIKNFNDPITAELPFSNALNIQSLYFRNLESKLEQDRKIFIDRLKECNGLDPKTNATQYATFFDRYTEQLLDINQVSHELGTTPERLNQVFTALVVQKKLDPVFVDLIKNPKSTIRRELFEELFPVLIIYLGGKIP